MIDKNSGWKYCDINLAGTSLPVMCSVDIAHPWSYEVGQKKQSGNYLSVENALSFLAKKIASTDDYGELVIILVVGDSLSNFLKNISSLTDVLPFPQLTQVKRLAVASSSLEADKMIIPALQPSAVSSMEILSNDSMRQVLNAQVITSAQQEAETGFSLEGIKSCLDMFNSIRESAINEIDAALADLKGKNSSAWVYSCAQSAATVGAELFRNVPEKTSVHCAAIMFTGSSLDGIRGLIHEHESNTGA